VQLRAGLRVAVSASGRHQFELLTGRTIRLARLDQHWTYGGLLAGHPSREMNRRIMDELITPRSGPRRQPPPVLFEPIETPLAKTADPSWNDAAALPAATCVAQFTSEALADDSGGFASVLRVIWFQDEFAFPIDPSIVVELAALDWEAQAVGWEP
jgi:hypothetical protein